jgi:hypothetical protein
LGGLLGDRPRLSDLCRINERRLRSLPKAAPPRAETLLLVPISTWKPKPRFFGRSVDLEAQAKIRSRRVPHVGSPIATDSNRFKLKATHHGRFPALWSIVPIQVESSWMAGFGDGRAALLGGGATNETTAFPSRGW